MLTHESTHLTAQQHHALLSELAQNDELRAELAKNPAETLKRFGVRLPSALANVALPTKEALAFYLGGRSGQSDPGEPPWHGVHV